MGTSNSGFRAYLEQVSAVTTKVRHTFELLLGERGRQEVEYDALPYAVRQVLAKEITVESMESGWWRVRGRHWDCTKGNVVSVEIPVESAGIPSGSTARIIQKEALRYFQGTACPSCAQLRDMGWGALRLRMASPEANLETTKGARS